MESCPLRSSVVGSYPFPGWLEFASQSLDRFGPKDVEELQEDAVIAAVHDQLEAGLDVITDGEQTRLDFNLSFYGHLEGISLESEPPRRWGPPAHDQRGKHAVTSTLRAPKGLGCVSEFQRLQRVAPDGQALKVSVPGPYTMSGRLLPNAQYPDRYALTEALLPLIRTELSLLVDAGCQEICVDEPSMSCYGHREDRKHLVDIFNRTVESARGRCRLATHLCFGNYKGRAIGGRKAAVLFPEFLDMHVDEMHIEMANTCFTEIELIAQVSRRMDAAVGIIDVKSYAIESAEEIAQRVRLCLKHAPADRLVFAPDCGLSQTARWASREKLKNMVAGIGLVKKSLGM